MLFVESTDPLIEGIILVTLDSFSRIHPSDCIIDFFVNFLINIEDPPLLEEIIFILALLKTPKIDFVIAKFRLKISTEYSCFLETINRIKKGSPVQGIDAECFIKFIKNMLKRNSKGLFYFLLKTQYWYFLALTEIWEVLFIFYNLRDLPKMAEAFLLKTKFDKETLALHSTNSIVTSLDQLLEIARNKDNLIVVGDICAITSYANLATFEHFILINEDISYTLANKIVNNDNFSTKYMKIALIKGYYRLAKFFLSFDKSRAYLKTKEWDKSSQYVLKRTAELDKKTNIIKEIMDVKNVYKSHKRMKKGFNWNEHDLADLEETKLEFTVSNSTDVKTSKKSKKTTVFDEMIQRNEEEKFTSVSDPRLDLPYYWQDSLAEALRHGEHSFYVVQIFLASSKNTVSIEMAEFCIN